MSNPYIYHNIMSMYTYLSNLKTFNMFTIYAEESFTLPETNIAPENRPLEKEIPIGNHHF